MSNSEKRSVARKLSVYLLAAGLAGFTGASTTTQATMLVYNNGGVGWSDGRPNEGSGGNATYDQILFKMDGTVLVDDVQIDPTLPNPRSIELMSEHFNTEFVWGDGYTMDTAFLRAKNAGVVATYWGAAAEASKLAGGMTVDATSLFATGDAEGDIGFYGYGWYRVVGKFSDRGFLGFYIEDDDGDRHYGWADITVSPARNAYTLHEFAVSDVKNLGVITGGGEVPEPLTLSLLALGATGLLAHRRH